MGNCYGHLYVNNNSCECMKNALLIDIRCLLFVVKIINLVVVPTLNTIAIFVFQGKLLPENHNALNKFVHYIKKRLTLRVV